MMIKLPKISASHWNSLSGLFEFVFKSKESLISLFDKMRDPESEWDEESYNCASGFLSSITDFNFCFFKNLLALFFSII